MKKISKVATASVLLFTLANPLAVFADNKVGNVSETSSNKTTQDLTITSEEINGDIVFHVTAQRDTYEAIVYAKINGKNYTYNLGNLKKGQVSKIVQPDVSINNNNASISKESNRGRLLPNTSAVRELVQKTVVYNNEIKGNVVEAKIVYKVYELVEKNSIQNEGREYISERNVKEGAIVKPEVLVKPEYKEVLGGAIVEPAVQPELPKAEEPVTPATPAPKVEKPVTPAPKAEKPVTPASKAEEPASPAPKVEKPVTPAPKAEKPASPVSKVEKPATPAPKEEKPVTPAPKAKEPASPAPKVEKPATPAPKVEKPASPVSKVEKPASPAPKVEKPATPAPKAEKPASPAPKAEEPAAPAPKAEEPATPAPKAEEPATPAPKADTPSEEVAPKDEKLEEAKKDGKDVIEKIAASKLSEIEKVKDEAEKVKLEAKLKELKEAGLEAINKAENHEAAVDATDEYQTKIDEINVPGEELPTPNYNKDNLTNGRNEGTTIENGSTAIGHGSGEATATAPTQPATETSSDSTPTAKPQPAATSETAASATSSFRNAPEVQVRARRVARAANQPEGTVNISYNYDGMPDINGFLSDPRENNTVAIPNLATEDEVKELVKAKIEAKAQELAKHGYKVKEKIVFEQDTDVKNFNYVVTFTKEKTGTSSFRNAPEVQVRTKKVVKRDLSNKTKKINIYYNLTALKDIAGALGELDGENMLTFPGNTPKEELKRAIEEKTKAQIEKLKKQGFKVVSTTDLDKIVEGGDSYDYVVEFTKESKSTSANNSGFRKAPLVQNRAKRSVEQKETVDIHIYFNLKTLPGIAGALDVDKDTTIQLPKDASKEQVKEVIKDKIAKVEKRGYKVTDAYFGAKTEHGYDFVVEFKK